MAKRQSSLNDFVQFFSSLKCGLLLLSLLGMAVTVGTLILQKPMAREGQIEELYAPQTIRLLNALGLFDVFHAWWFILLLGLLGANITLTSLERLPQAWRYFSRPHLVAEEWFVRQLTFKREIPLGSIPVDEALPLAAKKIESLGYRAKPESLQRGTLYVEKHRFARLAPYIVHTSLLIIFAGAIVDGIYGYRGYVSLGRGMRAQELEPLSPNAPRRRLPFTLRCDEAGMEKYPDGSPRQYWTWLAVEEKGREVLRKQIFVNEPLTYKGIRFFQASYGSTGTPSKVVVEASWPGQAQTLSLRPSEKVSLDEQGTQVELGDFLPDFVLEGNQITSRSSEPNNPAVRLVVTRAGGSPASVWVFPKSPDMNPPNDTGINFRFRDVEMEYITGLQVAKEPGQGLIWGGCLLLTGALMMALYMSHIRIWGVLGRDRKGKPVLVLGGQPSKYRESFEARFNALAEALEQTFRTTVAPKAELEHVSA
jgi:cytochrome c biogenesis protein